MGAGNLPSFTQRVTVQGCTSNRSATPLSRKNFDRFSDVEVGDLGMRSIRHLGDEFGLRRNHLRDLVLAIRDGDFPSPSGR
jgi:hypothetical protein